MQKINSSLHSRLIVVLLASMVGLSMHATETKTRPQLVVGIVVEGLQNDYLTNLAPYFTDGGFKRLMRDGMMITNADFGTDVDPLAATAMVMTGASPSVNGIGDDMIYDSEGLRLIPTMMDAEFMGNSTSETYSPRKLLVSTLADEVRIAGGGVTDVYAISPDPQQAVVLGGHAANSAFWLTNADGNWATTTFYKDIPALVAGRNRLTPLSSRLDTLSWTPLLPPADYPDLPDHIKRYPFKYVYARGNSDRYSMLKESALINSEVTSLATEFINNLGLGKHDGVDMLNLNYRLVTPDYSRNSDTRLELMDNYIRLDRNLEQLFSLIDRAGGGNSVIFLVATPPSSTVRRDEEKWNIPYGEFSTRKAGSLLNMYLMAIYGTGDWVNGYHNGHFYLNNKLIKDKSLDPKTVRSDAASFIARMSGVKEAYTIDQILAGNAGDNAAALKRNTHLPTAGDVLIKVTPGWEIINDLASGSSTYAKNQVERIVAPTAPAFILAPRYLSPSRIDTPVDVRAIAPTVARILRIRSPNGASLPALSHH